MVRMNNATWPAVSKYRIIDEPHGWRGDESECGIHLMIRGVIDMYITKAC